MTSALVPFTFNNVKLFTVTINGKSWTRAKEICKALDIKRQQKLEMLLDQIVVVKISLTSINSLVSFLKRHQ